MPFWNGMWGAGQFPFGSMILCAAILAIAIMFIMGMGPYRPKSDESALDTLNKRFANGEIELHEYNEKRRTLAS